MTFETPIIDWVALAPIIIVLGAGAIGILVEAFVRTPALRRAGQLQLTFVALIAALAWIIGYWVKLEGSGVAAVPLSVAVDRQSLLWQAIIVVLALLALPLFADRTKAGETPFTPLASASPGSTEEELARKKGMELTEVFPLALLAIGGMMLFVSATEFIMLFVALELFSLPLYIMVAVARRRRLLAQEAAVKYFLLGAFSSAILLFGVAMLYGANGRTAYSELRTLTHWIHGREELALLGIVLVLIGLFFKLGAVPFHSWVPDVYEGAPTPVTAFMAALVKVAAAAAFVRIAFSYLYMYAAEINWIIYAVAVLSMMVGSIIALRQTDIKRMLAYSSIGHAGFILVAIPNFPESALSAIPFYLLVYGLATVGAFAVVTQVRERSESGSLGAEATRLGQWAGLGKRNPLLAGAMAIFMLSFAGIPLTAGFIGKFVVFAAAVESGGWLLVLIAVVASAIAAFFYIRLVVLMFFTEAPQDVESAVSVEPSVLSRTVIIITAAATIILGVVPNLVLSLSSDSAQIVMTSLQ